MEPALGADGKPITVAIETRDGRLLAKVWLMHVGRVPLYLLDCDVEGNSPQDRELTSRLYGGDVRTRIRQELVLGVGGVEGAAGAGHHAGRLSPERRAQRVRPAGSDPPADAGRRPDVRRSAPRSRPAHRLHHAHAGAGRARPLRRRAWSRSILGPLRDKLGISLRAAHGPGPRRAAERARAVLHDGDRPQAVAAGQRGQLAARPRLAADVGPPLAVARRRRNPHRPHHQRRPHSHAGSPTRCTSCTTAYLRQRLAGLGWASPRSGRSIYNVDPGELWETHNALKNRLLEFVRRRVEPADAAAATRPDESIEAARTMLDPNVLTIGFARRFATYKRADLFFRDLDRMAELVNDPQRPVQFIFAGKAHPADEPGKQLIQKIANLRHDPRFAGRIVFIEDYDINVARHLVQGVDVWLNNPRRPLEASGTSGRRPCSTAGSTCRSSTAGGPRPTTARTASRSATARQHVDDEITDARDAQNLYQRAATRKSSRCSTTATPTACRGSGSSG